MLWLVAIVGWRGGRAARGRDGVDQRADRAGHGRRSFRLVVRCPPVGTEVRPGWQYLLIAFAALLIGGGIGVDGLSAEMKSGASAGCSRRVLVICGGAGQRRRGGLVALAGASGPIERTRLAPSRLCATGCVRGSARLLAIDLSSGVARYTCWPMIMSDSAMSTRVGVGGRWPNREQVDDLVIRFGPHGRFRHRPQLLIWDRLPLGLGRRGDVVSRITNTQGLGTRAATRVRYGSSNRRSPAP